MNWYKVNEITLFTICKLVDVNIYRAVIGLKKIHKRNPSEVLSENEIIYIIEEVC